MYAVRACERNVSVKTAAQRSAQFSELSLTAPLRSRRLSDRYGFPFSAPFTHLTKHTTYFDISPDSIYQQQELHVCTF